MIYLKHTNLDNNISATTANTAFKDNAVFSSVNNLLG